MNDVASIKQGWLETLQTDVRGGYRQNHANLMTALRNTPQWRGVITYDEFSQVVWLNKPVPRHDGKVLNDWRPRYWSDADLGEAVEWFQLDIFPTVNPEKVQMAIRQFANQNGTFHPVRDYLNGLHWDRCKRLDQWLVKYLGAVPYTNDQLGYLSEVGSKWMISAVARIYEPGCQADHVLVPEGPQGIGKSTAFKILGGDSFSDGLPSNVHTKDARDHVRGKWIIEFPELSQMNKTEVEAIKAFITRREERFRPAYGRNEVIYPRQCVFCGTTNKEEYLRDETGNRRFWPVTVTNILIGSLVADRDQLWAEAVARYQKGEAWHLTDQSVIDIASAEQSARYLSDAWEEPVTKYLNGKDKVTISEILKNAIFLDISKQSRADQNRVMPILADNGFKRGKRTGRGRWWERNP